MNASKLRFKADDGSKFPEWEESTLGQHGQVLMCRRIFKEQTSSIGDVPFYKIGTFGGTPDAFISKELFEEYKSKYPFPKKGNVLISASGSIGRTVEYKGEEAYFQDSNIVWLDHGDEIDDSFLKQFYANVSWSGLEGSTIKRLYNKIILDTPINLPSIEEQHKIADFFSTLDQIIDKTQAEVDAWEKQKQGMMQKLFSQEIRFKADDGSEYPEWEEKQLSDVCASFDYGMNTAATKFDGIHKYLRITDIDDETHQYMGKYIVSPSGNLDQKYLVQEGDIFFARTGASTGKTYHYKKEDGILYFAGFLIRGKVKPEFDDRYIFYQTLTNNYNKWVKIMSMRSGQPGINANEYASYTFLCATDLNEQRKIADCLSAFDSIIDKTKQELEAYKLLKTGLMQQMFV